MDKREACLIIASGAKGVGKSYLTFFKYILEYVQGVPSRNIPGRKVLIFDVNDEYGLMKVNPSDQEGVSRTGGGKTIHVKALALRDVRRFSANNEISVRRIRPIHTETVYERKKNGEKGKCLHRKGEIMHTTEVVSSLLQVIESFRGGLLLIEDLSSMFGNSLPLAITGAITKNRHINLDIIMHVQTVAVILPRLWQNANFTRFHKQIDGIDKSKTKLQEKYVFYRIAEELVNYQYDIGNIRYFVWIDNMKAKLIGNFDKQQLMDAIDRYIRKNYRNELYNLLQERTREGNTVYTYETALQTKKLELYRKYNGNI